MGLHVMPAILILSTWFTILFGAVELWRRLLHPNTETTRKASHIASGLSALIFPFIFNSSQPVFILCVLSVVLMSAGKYAGALRSVHGVARQTYGTSYFPIAVFVIFWLSQDQRAYYVISILVLTLADASAALIGKTYGTLQYSVEDDKKTLEGSFAFLTATFLCVHVPLLLMTNVGRAECVLVALIISILVTGLEAISLEGADNLIIPLLTFYILRKITVQPLQEIIRQIGILALITVVICATDAWRRSLRGIGFVGLILLLYLDTCQMKKWQKSTVLSEDLRMLSLPGC